MAAVIPAAAAIVIPLLATSQSSPSSVSSPGETAAGKLAASLTDPGTAGVTAVAFSPSSTTMATTDSNARTYLWNINGY
jgi:hypothetical protein